MAGDLKTEQQIINRFQELRMSVESMWNKIIELESEASEHELVIKTLEPMDPARKCYRQIGGRPLLGLVCMQMKATGVVLWSCPVPYLTCHAQTEQVGPIRSTCHQGTYART